MGARVVFRCDHEGCDVTYALDSAESAPLAEANVPLDLSPVVRFLTDDPARGGRGWEFALNQVSPLTLLVHKCFCPEHGVDLKAMPEYKPDAAAKQHARRRP